MKTKVISTALICMMIFASANVFAGKPQSTMPFYTLKGIVEIPVKVEEAPDSLPDVVKLFNTRNAEEVKCLVHTQFDLSKISKPEPDADDVVINTQRIFAEMRYREYARR